MQRSIFLVRSFAEVGVEAVVADCQGEVVSACFLVLFLPNAATLDQLAARRAPENAVCWGEGLSLVMGSTVMPRSNVRVEMDPGACCCFDVVVVEFDAVRGHCFSPCLCCNDGHFAAVLDP